MTAPLVGIVMGSDSDWEVMQHASAAAARVRRAAREPGRERAPDAGPAVPLCRGGAGPRAALHHRGRGRRGAPARHARRQDAPCPCSACRSRPSTCRASIRCSPSSRCRRACRWPPSPSARPARTTRGSTRWRMLAVERPGARATARRVPRGADRAGPRAQAPGAGVILPGATVGMLGGGQLGRMFTLRARQHGLSAWSCSIPTRAVRRATSPIATSVPTTPTSARSTSSRPPARRSPPSSRTSRRRPSSGWPAPALVRPAGRRPSRSPRTGSPRSASSQAAGFATAPFRAVHERRGARGRGRPHPDCPPCSRPAGWATTARARRRSTDSPSARRRSSGSAGCRACWRSGWRSRPSCRWCWPAGADGAVARVSGGREPAPGRHPRDHRRPGPRVAERLADEARALAIARGRADGVRRRAGRGAVRRQRRAALRQRDGPAPAQQRALHDGRVHGRPVRAAAPRALRPAAGRAPAAQSGGHDQPPGRPLGCRASRAGPRRCGVPASACISTARPSRGPAGRWATSTVWRPMPTRRSRSRTTRTRRCSGRRVPVPPSSTEDFPCRRCFALVAARRAAAAPLAPAGAVPPTPPARSCTPNDVPAEGRKSPLDSLTFTVAGQPVKLCYGRPSSRGRTMLGGEADSVRQAMAHRRQRADDLLHAGSADRGRDRACRPGTYSLYTVPDAGRSGRSSSTGRSRSGARRATTQLR